MPTTPGDYRLLADSNSGTLTGVNLSNFVLPASPSPSTIKYTLDNTSDPGYLDLVVNAVDVPPQIVGVYVSSSAWKKGLFSALAAAGVGSTTLGYELASGEGN